MLQLLCLPGLVRPISGGFDEDSTSSWGCRLPLVALGLIGWIADIPSPWRWFIALGAFLLVASTLPPLAHAGRLRLRQMLGKEIVFRLGPIWRTDRPWFIHATNIGSAHSASATSYTAGTATASASDSGVEERTATFVYLPVENTHRTLTADPVEATFEFEALTGRTILGPVSARWMNSENPANQSPLTDPSAFDRHRIPARMKESLDLVYYVAPGTSYVYTNELARRGVIPDSRTRIADSTFRIKVSVTAPNAEDFHASLLATWRGPELLIEPELA